MWVGGEIIPFIIALVCLITSLAGLFMGATGVRLCNTDTKGWPRSLVILDLLQLDLQYHEVLFSIVVPCPGDGREDIVSISVCNFFF